MTTVPSLFTQFFLYRSLFVFLISFYTLAGGPTQRNFTAKEVTKLSSNYPYFEQIYKGDIKFRAMFRKMCKSLKVKSPWWIPNGVQTPMKPIIIDGLTYLQGSICEPHNCGMHFIEFVYFESNNRLVAKYKSPNSDLVWFGDPNKSEYTYLEKQ